MTNAYHHAGIPLAAAGAALAPTAFYVINSIPLTAAGISALILGFTIISLARPEPEISAEACRILLKTDVENSSTILEELNIRNKAIYLPRKMTNGHPQAIVPLDAEENVQAIIKKIPPAGACDDGWDARDGALAFTTPGNISLDLLEGKPGSSAADIRSAMRHVLVGVLNIASSIKVDLRDSRLKIEVYGNRIPGDDRLFYQCLGSPVASIAAAVSSEALEKPVRIIEETQVKKTRRIVIEVLS